MGMKIARIPRGSPRYPGLLVEAPSPPARLFTLGLPLEPAPFIAVVGTRKCTSYGISMAKKIAADLTRSGLVVVSGLATGIDAAAHQGALEAGGSTVAVLGSGIDICYPRRNRHLYDAIKSAGTLVTEYEAGEPPLPHRFPQRNRIIAGMSIATVIVEAGSGGGAMITSRLAMEMGREVFAIPGPAHSRASDGPHLLIRDGARLVASAAQILDDLGILPKGSVSQESPGIQLTIDEALVARSLESSPMLLDLISERVGMPASSVAATLASLELKGVAMRGPGGRFALSPNGC